MWKNNGKAHVHSISSLRRFHIIPPLLPFSKVCENKARFFSSFQAMTIFKLALEEKDKIYLATGTVSY